MKPALKIFVMAVLLLLIAASHVKSQIKDAIDTRIASYHLTAKLDVNKKIIDGREILRWKNTSPDIINELQFHMYLNAFKNNRSTFDIESKGDYRDFGFDESNKEHWGYIDVVSMKVVNGSDLTGNIRFIQPDDGNKDDQTVIAVKLDNPLKPGDEINLDITFKSKLPKVSARSGYADDYFLVGQWFPKIGVYEYPGIRHVQKSAWNCHQYHSNSEFYADFADYDVHITLPKNYIVGAVGNLVSKSNNNDGSTTHYYRAEDVLDFAWTASPKFMEVTDQWQNVKIKLLIQPEHYYQASRYIMPLKASLEYFDKHIGHYPYNTITVVDPPLSGFHSGGMEYPTFFTGYTLWGLPDEMRLPEMVTVHEFGHNYFMGIIATNEFEEAFLDEGFNQYFECRIMDHVYGTHTGMMDWLGFKMGDFEYVRQNYVGSTNPKRAEIYRKSWEYTAGGYGTFTYLKTAVMLRTLDGLVGIKTMDEIMKTYYERWKFKHPNVKDFIAIVNEIVRKNHGTEFGEDMNWYFDQVLYGTDVCDYKLASIKNDKVNGPIGLFEKEKGRQFLKNSRNDNYKSSVMVYRMGEVKLPVEVLVHFDNGKEIIEKWDGKARTAEFKYEGKGKVIWAKVDPYSKIPLDVNIINNSLTTEPEEGVFMKYAAKILFWLQNVMLTFSMLF